MHATKKLIGLAFPPTAYRSAATRRFTKFLFERFHEQQRRS